MDDRTSGVIESQETIMVIDDTAGNLMLLDYMLRAHGYRVLTFPEGALALQAMKRHTPNLVLLDIDMPGMGGYEVCEAIKADPATADIPVIFLSAYSDINDKIKAFGAGGIDYVTKPFQAEEVISRVRTHLKIQSLQAALQRYNEELEERVNIQVKEIMDTQLAVIFAMARLTEFRDDDTGHHIERTAVFCRRLAEWLRDKSEYRSSIGPGFIDTIYHTAPLHDIGKVGIPDRILLKPASLDPEEWRIMKTHTDIGLRTLDDVRREYVSNPFILMGLEITGSHHERWDGTGYPQGLAGLDIPLSARIMALADVYDALRSRRPYKEPMDHEAASRVILEGSGSHFDPEVVRAFVAISHELEVLYQDLSDGDGH